MNAKAGALADKQQLSPELVAVIDAFHEMKDALTKAQASIFQDGQMGLPARMVKPAATDPYHARRIALHAIGDWYFDEGQAPSETKAYIGVVACSLDSINLLNDLNNKKLLFQEAVKELKASLHRRSQKRKAVEEVLYEYLDAELSFSAQGGIGNVIRDETHKRLNLKQTHRAIPTSLMPPRRVRWAWVSNQSICRVKRNQAIDMLMRKPMSAAIEHDYKLLMALPEDEELAMRKKPVTELRMSLVVDYPGAGEGKGATKTRYELIKSRIPLFYYSDPESIFKRLPELQVTQKDRDIVPRERRQTTEKTPYIASLKLYRYLKK